MDNGNKQKEILEKKNYVKPRKIKPPMSKKKIAIISAVSAVVLAVTLWILSPYIAPDYIGSWGLEYEITSDTTCEITGFDEFDIGYLIFKSVRIPKYIGKYTVTSIGDHTFVGCDSLTSITIPDSVTSIGDRAFSGCTSLTSITIPNSVTTIGNYAFSVCSSLTSITISDSVTSIGNYAFYNCTSLTSITIPDSVTSIGKRAFSKCYHLAYITVSSNNTSYKSINGVLHTYYEKTIVCFPAGKSDISYSIPVNVTFIGDSAFYNCNSLISVTIPDSVTAIGGSAFDSCDNLTSITIPDSVTFIGNDAFKDCYHLTSINYEGTISEWNKISKGFDWDNRTPDYTVYCTDGTIAKDGTVKYN